MTLPVPAKISTDGSIVDFTGLLPKQWFVNPGVTTTGNGSSLAPFKTVTEAMAVVSSGDAIVIGPGTTVENVEIPNGVDVLTMTGAGIVATAIEAPVGSLLPTVKFKPTSGAYTKLNINNMTLRNTNNGATGTGAEVGQVIYFDGTSIAVADKAPLFTENCLIDHVIADKGTSTGDGFYFKAVDKLTIRDGNGSTISQNIAGWNCSGMFVNPGKVLQDNTIFGNGVTGYSVEYNDTPGQIRPTGGRQGFDCYNGATIYGKLTLKSAVMFHASAESAIYGDIDATALALFTGPAHAPDIKINSVIGSEYLPCAVTVVCPAITAGAVAAGSIPIVDFSGATIYQTNPLSTKTFSMSGAVGAVRFKPQAIGTKFRGFPETASAKIIAGAETDLSILNAYYRQDNLSAVGNGTIDRQAHSLGNLVSPLVQAFTPPFPSGTSLHASVTATTAVAIGGSATVSSVTLVGAGTANVTVTRNP